MNYVKMMITVPLLIGLVGCNNKEPKVEVNHQQAEQTQQAQQTERVVKGDEVKDPSAMEKTFNFNEFSLDVEYENDISYEVDYEKERNAVSAEIEDEVNNVHKKGDEAFTQLSKQLEQLTFTEQSTDDEVLKQVMDVFELDENYITIEVDVTYNDGNKKEYHFRK